MTEPEESVVARRATEGLEAAEKAIYLLVGAALVIGALLVLGSSLTVMSGFRFVRYAASIGRPVVVVNRGATRGDAHAAYKIDGGTTEFLTHPAWASSRTQVSAK